MEVKVRNKRNQTWLSNPGNDAAIQSPSSERDRFQKRSVSSWESLFPKLRFRNGAWGRLHCGRRQSHGTYVTIASTPVRGKSWRTQGSPCHALYWSGTASSPCSDRGHPLRPSTGSGLRHPLCPLWSSPQELERIAPDSLRERRPPLRVCSGPRRKLQSQISSHVYRPNAPAWLPSLPSVFATRKEYKGYVATAALRWIHLAIISHYCCFCPFLSIQITGSLMVPDFICYLLFLEIMLILLWKQHTHCFEIA